MIITPIKKLIAGYASSYELLDWISIDKIDWYALSGNPNAIELLMQNQDKIDWNELSENPSIFKLNIDKILKNLINL